MSEVNEWHFTNKQFRSLLRLIKNVTGLTQLEEKKHMLEVRLHKRARELNLKNFSEYFAVLGINPQVEIPFLINLCTTHTTDFFREPGHFDYLIENILTPMLKDGSIKHKIFRIWCAASSSGEEPYTLSMVLHDFYLKNDLKPQYIIYASDIDAQVVNIGKRGVYSNKFLSRIPNEFQKFIKKGKGPMSDFFRIDKELNSHIRWNIQNLFQPFFLTEKNFLDAIFVRNVFIYFDDKEIEECVNRMSYILRKGGQLFLGHSEHLNNIVTPFHLVRNAVYSNKVDFNKDTVTKKSKIITSRRSDSEATVVKHRNLDITKILIVDDSKTIHTILGKVFDDKKEYEVVGNCFDGKEALEFLKTNRVDVILSDINMPNMNGIELLEEQMKEYRIPTLMISSFSKEDGGYFFQALEKGAVDYIEKPQGTDLTNISKEVLLKVQVARKALNINNAKIDKISIKSSYQISKKLSHKQIILIGSSTGGPQALEIILSEMPNDVPPILITQHMPAAFVEHFARRLNDTCGVKVQMAEMGMEVHPGNVYISPGDKHMEIMQSGSRLLVSFNTTGLYKGPTSVDCLFKSASGLVGKYDILAVILTGMGKDGAAGMKELFDRGVYTLAQDEASSVVWGMAGTAVSLGAVSKELPLNCITGRVLSQISQIQRGIKKSA